MPPFFMHHINEVLHELEKHFPNPKSDLHYTSPWQLLVAVILSAQCTDVRVNIVTKSLFLLYPDVYTFSKMTYEQLEPYIQSTGFFRNKARNIIDAAHMIIEKWNGEIPLTMEELLSLPGIGRKSANVLMTVYGETQGIVVDTHVIRVSDRLYLTQSKNPEIIENDLKQIIPSDKWAFVNQALVLFGRYICKARNPECEKCSLQTHCKVHNGKVIL